MTTWRFSARAWTAGWDRAGRGQTSGQAPARSPLRSPPCSGHPLSSTPWTGTRGRFGSLAASVAARISACLDGPRGFAREVSLPPLDGILMANSLHFHGDACALLLHTARWLKPGGLLILVEYDIETPNPWVPHPLPWVRFPAAAECAGFTARGCWGRAQARTTAGCTRRRRCASGRGPAWRERGLTCTLRRSK